MSHHQMSRVLNLLRKNGTATIGDIKKKARCPLLRHIGQRACQRLGGTARTGQTREAMQRHGAKLFWSTLHNFFGCFCFVFFFCKFDLFCYVFLIDTFFMLFLLIFFLLMLFKFLKWVFLSNKYNFIFLQNIQIFLHGTL